MQTDLGIKMVARADKDNLPADHVIRTTAQEFEEKAIGFWAEPQTCAAKSFLGAWARARKAWREYSGESIL